MIRAYFDKYIDGYSPHCIKTTCDTFKYDFIN